MTAPLRTLALAFAMALAACSGEGRDATGPDPVPPGGDPQVPVPAPTPEPGPEPQPGVQGIYVLAGINGWAPGRLVTIANPDGLVIGLYRFEATTLTLDALQQFELTLRFTDDKSPFAIDDAGEFKQAGPVTEGGLPLAFSSAVYGDSFTGVALGSAVEIEYDFDGDGRHDTTFAFQRVE